jgi:lysophospholipase L1-like esterase
MLMKLNNFTLNFIKKIIFFLFILIVFLSTIKAADIFLNIQYGLGNVVLYDNSIINGYNLRPNQKITNRRNNTISINDEGMRSNNDWSNSNSRKILFIGDSVTYGGSIVSNNELFSEKICQKLNVNNKKFLCGNYAVNGYSIISMKNKIEYKKFNDEEFIIIVLVASDMERNFHNLYSQPFYSKKISNFFPALTELINTYLERFISNIKHQNNSVDLEIKSEKYKNFTKTNIENLSKITKKSNKKIILVYSPEISEISNKNKFFYYKNILKNNFPNFIDMTYYISREKNFNKIYYDHMHLNTEGHEFYANIIKDYLINKFNL